MMTTHSLRVFRDALFCVDDVILAKKTAWLCEGVSWRPSESPSIEGPISLVAIANVSSDTWGLKDGDYRLMNRSEGQQCRHRGMTKSLKKLLNAAGVPPWLRDAVPIVYDGQTVAAIADNIVCDGYSELGGWRVLWRR